MSLLTIEGTYKDGRIELAEHPDWPAGEARVLVTFLPGSRSGPTAEVEVDHDREALRQRALRAWKKVCTWEGHPTLAARSSMTDSTSSPRALVDTNVVVYAYDLDEPRKHDIARELLKRLSDEGRLVFSAQVFNESCSAMMRPKREKPLRPDEIAVILRELEATGDVVPITSSMTFRGLDAMPRHGLSFWDALDLGRGGGESHRSDLHRGLSSRPHH